ncbi:MAG: hypothetical protein ACRC62_35830 [Microcoleus sp.]
MNNKLLFLGSSACVFTVLTPVPGIFAKCPPVRHIPPIPVSEILSQLKGKTQVPIFIPSNLPQFWVIYYSSEATTNSYRISLERTADCRGSGACTLGEIRAQKGGEFATKIAGVTKTLKNVQLTGGVKGVFHNGCGAYCTANIEWKTRGFLYTIAIRNGKETDLIDMANSSIQAGVR